ncbi:hypothetical protein PROFUN_15540, partial [Planoprotostelium fungivorum]
MNGKKSELKLNIARPVRSVSSDYISTRHSTSRISTMMKMSADFNLFVRRRPKENNFRLREYSRQPCVHLKDWTNLGFFIAHHLLFRPDPGKGDIDMIQLVTYFAALDVSTEEMDEAEREAYE